MKETITKDYYVPANMEIKDGKPLIEKLLHLLPNCLHENFAATKRSGENPYGDAVFNLRKVSITITQEF
jgi:hypothetical protein